MLVAEEAQLNQVVQAVQEVQVEVDRQQVIRELVVMQRFMEAEEVQVHLDLPVELAIKELSSSLFLKD
jgi:hypothetical protein